MRIVYIHVAVAWLSMVGFIVISVAGAMHLLGARVGLGPLGPARPPNWAGWRVA